MAGKEEVVLDKEELESKAEDIYHATMCSGAGCCGDFYGAVEFLLTHFQEVLDKQASTK